MPKLPEQPDPEEIAKAHELLVNAKYYWIAEERLYETPTYNHKVTETEMDAIKLILKADRNFNGLRRKVAYNSRRP